MAKVTQKESNMLVEEHYNRAMKEFADYHTEWCKFLNCRADYCFTKNYIILRSYSTIVAVIARSEGVCYDASRLICGYTVATNQLIIKFWEYFESTRIVWHMSEQDYKQYIIRVLEDWNKQFGCKLRIDELNGKETHNTTLQLMNENKYYCTTISWSDMFHRLNLIREGMEIMLNHCTFTR